MTLPEIKTDPPLRLLSAYSRLVPGTQPELVIQAAGRDMWIAASVDGVTDYTLFASDIDRSATFSWRSARRKQSTLKRPLPGWSRLAAATVAHLCEGDLNVPGFYAVVASSEAQGPRFNFTLGVAVATLLYEVHGNPYSHTALVEIVERVQREMDHK